jgi:hypothetical protein
MLVNGVLQARRPLALTAWLGRTGMSELPPIVCQTDDDRGGWAARVSIDVAALRGYAGAVYAATDVYFAAQTARLPTRLSRRVLTALLLDQRALLREAWRFAIC